MTLAVHDTRHRTDTGFDIVRRLPALTSYLLRRRVRRVHVDDLSPGARRDLNLPPNPSHDDTQSPWDLVV